MGNASAPLGKIVRTTAEALDDKGAGVTKILRGEQTIDLRVTGLLPGEAADVAIEHRSPHAYLSFGRIVRRHQAAEERVVPVCPAYGRCGGCAMQHLSYEAQLRWKAERLRAVVEDGPLIHPEAPCVPAENGGLGQRSRAKFVAAPGGVQGQRVVLGAYAPRSHEVLDLSGCRMVTPVLRAAAQAVAAVATERGISCYDERTGEGGLRHVLLRDTAAGAVQVSLVFAALPPDEALAALAAAIAQAEPRTTSITVHENRTRTNALLPSEGSAGDRVLFGEGALWERIEVPGATPLHLRVGPRSFLQVNRPMAARLYADVLTVLAPAPGERLLDLYCGVGGIGLAAAVAVPGLALVGIEENPAAVADAEASAARAGVQERATFRLGDAAAGLEAASEAPTICVVNPPRKGCDRAVLETLAAQRPRALAYVSCDLETLGRDLAVLAERGYRVTQAAAYDMHPHTPHVEALVTLRPAE